MLNRLFIIFAACFTSNLLFGQAQHYYWVGNSKHYFQIDSSELLLEVMSLENAKSERLRKDADVRTFRVKDVNTQQFVILENGKKGFLERNALTSARYITYPSIRETETGAVAFITDEITVQFKDEPDLKLFSSKYDIKLVEKTPYGAYLFKVLNNSKTLETANRIKEKENVVWSNPNFVNIIYLNQVNNDPLYPNQYYLNNTGQNGGTANIDINAPEAWAITLGCTNIRVAVLDDGVDNNHEDLAGRVVPGFTAGFNNTGGVPLNHCSKGHGINCAGIIAASHNNLGIRGVAPNSQIVPVNIFPNQPTLFNLGGAATNDEIATAINWAWRADGGNADILSNSWGGGLQNNDIINEITRARTEGRGGLGAVVVFASGNSNPRPGCPVGQGCFNGVAFPGNVDGVITVGAIDRNGNIWNYSSRGPEMDLVAPSGGLGTIDLNSLCTTPGGDVSTTDRMGNQGYDNGNYTQAFGGTSAACPQVAGVAALMLSVSPNLTEVQVRTILQNTATDMGANGFDNTFGFGRLNAHAAIQALMPTISGPNILCSSNSYTLQNLPAGSTVSWSVSPSGVVSISGSGSGVNLTPLSNGQATVTASITSTCGITTQVGKTLLVATAAIPTSSITLEPFESSPYVCPSQTYSLIVGPYVPGYQYEVQVTNGTYTMVSPNQFWIHINSYIPSQYADAAVSARVHNGCGWSDWRGISLFSDPFACPPGGGGCSPGSGDICLVLYPNPSSEEVSVSLLGIEENEMKTGQKLGEGMIYLYDSNGTLRKSASISKEKTLYIRDLPAGQYVLHYQNGKTIIKRQLRIEK